MKRLSQKAEQQNKPALPAAFLNKHKAVLDAVKNALNFIEPNYNDDESDDSDDSSHSSYESSSEDDSSDDDDSN